jgi:hypothetical protein
MIANCDKFRWWRGKVKSVCNMIKIHLQWVSNLPYTSGPGARS